MFFAYTFVSQSLLYTQWWLHGMWIPESSLLEHSLVWLFCLMSTILILFIDNLPPPTRTVAKALLFPASQVYIPVSSLWTFFRIRIDPVRMFNPLFTIIEASLYQWMARSWLFGFTTQFMLIFLLMSLT